ncbi:MAG: hypothetical protein IKR21_05190 [Oscillospiraceae bacterium]|nr:hypothetical protein [Oscillospiraceae bacterium]
MTENTAQRVRREFSEAESVTMNVKITADYGERVYDFALRFTGTESACRIEITSPEELRGLSAVTDETGERLVYEGAAFETGGLFGDGSTPVAALPLMIKTWKTGYASERSRENLNGRRLSALSYELESGTLKTWFDIDTLLPVKTEISENGRVALTAVFGNVALE